MQMSGHSSHAPCTTEGTLLERWVARLTGSSARRWVGAAYGSHGPLGLWPSVEQQRDVRALEMAWQSRFWCVHSARLNERGFALDMAATFERLRQSHPHGTDRLHLVGVRMAPRAPTPRARTDALKAAEAVVAGLLKAWSGQRFDAQLGTSDEGDLLALATGRSDSGVEDLLDSLRRASSPQVQVAAQAQRLLPSEAPGRQVRHLVHQLHHPVGPASRLPHLPTPARHVQSPELPGSHRISRLLGRTVQRDEAAELQLMPALACARRSSFRDICNRDMTLLSFTLEAIGQDASPRYIALSRQSWNNEVSRQMLLWTLERHPQACSALHLGVPLNDAFNDAPNFAALKALAHRFGARVGTLGLGVRSPGAKELLRLRPDYAVTAAGLAEGLATLPQVREHLARLATCAAQAGVGGLIIHASCAEEALAVAALHPEALVLAGHG